MCKYRLKYFILFALTIITSTTIAMVKTGIGTSAEYRESTINEVEGAEDWCISRVLNDLTCIDGGNNPDYSSLFNDVHSVICSADMALSPVFKSSLGEVAKGPEKFGYKFWAFSFEVPAGNVLNLVQNLPLYFIKSKVDGAINIVSNNILEDLKRKGDEYKFQHLMLESLNELVKARDCSNRRFTTQFTKETVVKTQLQDISECEWVAYRKQNENYGHYCARVASRNTVLTATYPVSITGEIFFGSPNSQTQRTDDLSVSAECGDSCYIGNYRDAEAPSSCDHVRSSCEFKQKSLKMQMGFSAVDTSQSSSKINGKSKKK